MTHIAREDCIVGHAYSLRSRNLGVGVWTGVGFVGPRWKFDPEPYCFVEYHHDDGPPLGTALPQADLGECPIADLAEGHSVYHEDEDRTYFHNNQPLTDWLVAKLVEVDS